MDIKRYIDMAVRREIKRYNDASLSGDVKKALQLLDKWSKEEPSKSKIAEKASRFIKAVPYQFKKDQENGEDKASDAVDKATDLYFNNKTPREVMLALDNVKSYL